MTAADDFDPRRWAEQVHPSAAPQRDWDADYERLCASSFEELADILGHRAEPLPDEAADRLIYAMAHQRVWFLGPLVISYTPLREGWAVHVDRAGSISVSTPWRELAVMTRRYWDQGSE